VEHFGIMYFGTDPKDLRQMRKSPIRLNMTHPNTIFPGACRLKPGTAYYYTVDSTGPDGTSDGVKRFGEAVRDATSRAIENRERIETRQRASSFEPIEPPDVKRLVSPSSAAIECGASGVAWRTGFR
jgi:hypothetical protein